jgi:hypothetical protein
MITEDLAPGVASEFRDRWRPAGRTFSGPPTLAVLHDHGGCAVQGHCASPYPGSRRQPVHQLLRHGPSPKHLGGPLIWLAPKSWLYDPGGRAGGWPGSAGGGRAGGAGHDPGGHRGGRDSEQHTAGGASARGPARNESHRAVPSLACAGVTPADTRRAWHSAGRALAQRCIPHDHGVVPAREGCVPDPKCPTRAGLLRASWPSRGRPGCEPMAGFLDRASFPGSGHRK